MVLEDMASIDLETHNKIGTHKYQLTRWTLVEDVSSLQHVVDTLDAQSIPWTLVGHKRDVWCGYSKDGKAIIKNAKVVAIFRDEPPDIIKTQREDEKYE